MQSRNNYRPISKNYKQNNYRPCNLETITGQSRNNYRSISTQFEANHKKSQMKQLQANLKKLLANHDEICSRNSIVPISPVITLLENSFGTVWVVPGKARRKLLKFLVLPRISSRFVFLSVARIITRLNHYKLMRIPKFFAFRYVLLALLDGVEILPLEPPGQSPAELLLLGRIHWAPSENIVNTQCCGAGAGLFTGAGAGEKAPAPGCCCVA